MSSKLFSIFSILLLSSFSWTQTHSTKKNQFDHFVEINEHWKEYSTSLNHKEISYPTDEDRIKDHLLAVIHHLNKADVSKLSPNQISNRISLLKKLETYANQKVFPKNIYHKKKDSLFC